MHELIKQFGKPFASELIGILMINKGELEMDRWRSFLLKHGLIKKTTKIIRANVFYRGMCNEWYVRLRNGRGNYIIYIVVTDNDMKQIRMELSE